MPVEVRNLPPYVRVLDVGLNGVLITEDESRRSFTIEALPMAEPGEQLIYVAGQVFTIATFVLIMLRAPNVPVQRTLTAAEIQRLTGPAGERGPVGLAGPRGATGDAAVRVVRGECV